MMALNNHNGVIAIIIPLKVIEGNPYGRAIQDQATRYPHRQVLRHVPEIANVEPAHLDDDGVMEQEYRLSAWRSEKAPALRPDDIDRNPARGAAGHGKTARAKSQPRAAALATRLTAIAGGITISNTISSLAF
jgi:hypothetical protein